MKAIRILVALALLAVAGTAYAADSGANGGCCSGCSCCNPPSSCCKK